MNFREDECLECSTKYYCLSNDLTKNLTVESYIGESLVPQLCDLTQISYLPLASEKMGDLSKICSLTNSFKVSSTTHM